MPGRAASDMRSGVAVAGGNLAFVGGKGGKNFVGLGFRDLEYRQGPSGFRCNLVEFCGRDPQIPVRRLKPERCGVGLGGGKREATARNVAATISARLATRLRLVKRFATASPTTILLRFERAKGVTCPSLKSSAKPGTSSKRQKFRQSKPVRQNA